MSCQGLSACRLRSKTRQGDYFASRPQPQNRGFQTVCDANLIKIFGIAALPTNYTTNYMIQFF